MVKHLVFFTLKDQAGGNTKAENIALIKAKIAGLNGKIPGLIKVEIGEDFSATAVSSDIALYSEFESREALAVYNDHPDHVVVKEFIASVASGRQLVDYEI